MGGAKDSERAAQLCYHSNTECREHSENRYEVQSYSYERGGRGGEGENRRSGLPQDRGEWDDDRRDWGRNKGWEWKRQFGEGVGGLGWDDQVLAYFP